MPILSGLFRKCVIADNCALLANAAFAGQLAHNCISLLVGIYAFAWQIYGDFSGYSDIARGECSATRLPLYAQFPPPYLATSLRDFWHRWHISLSTWLRDYLYIPWEATVEERFVRISTCSSLCCWAGYSTARIGALSCRAPYMVKGSLLNASLGHSEAALCGYFRLEQPCGNSGHYRPRMGLLSCSIGQPSGPHA